MNRMKRLLCLGLICYFCCLSMIVYGNEKTSPFYLAELKCENLIDPLGIDNVTPHFSWKLKGDGWKGGQTYYEIQVASDSILLVQDKADFMEYRKIEIQNFGYGTLSGKGFNFSFFVLLAGTRLGC